MIEQIVRNNKILALILHGNHESEGVNFITSKENSFQVGILDHKQGSIIKPHVHRAFPRTIPDTQEVLHLEKGMVEVEFYDEDGEKCDRRMLMPGDTILLVSGGHGFNILEDCRIIEIKQGPYGGADEDKQRFDNSDKAG